MIPLDRHPSGRHFLQIPGPTNVPDRDHTIKAVCVVHNETSTGVANRLADVRAAGDRDGSRI